MSEIHALNLEPGDVVGGYTLVSRLGAGAMGSVWRVVDDGGQQHAMKILRDSLGDEDEDPNSPAARKRVTARERLRREAMALRKIHNPGVCAIDDMELDDSVAFIVTELIEGENLREDVAHNGRYIAEDLERLASKLITAVQAVHDAGIVHRDIKPTNVMVSLSGPILVDFGIAMGAGESHVTSTGLVMGTPGFIAPEIIDGAESDEATDWWSTASVLAFAATGQPVFGTSPMMAVLEREASGNANLAGLPPRTMAAFRSALNPDRSKRCTPQELLNAITQDAWDATAWQDASETGMLASGSAAGLAGTAGSVAGSVARKAAGTAHAGKSGAAGNSAEEAMRPFGSHDPQYGSVGPHGMFDTSTVALSRQAGATEAELANPRSAWHSTPPTPPAPPTSSTSSTSPTPPVVSSANRPLFTEALAEPATNPAREPATEVLGRNEAPTEAVERNARVPRPNPVSEPATQFTPVNAMNTRNEPATQVFSNAQGSSNMRVSPNAQRPSATQAMSSTHGMPANQSAPATMPLAAAQQPIVSGDSYQSPGLSRLVANTEAQGVPATTVQPQWNVVNPQQAQPAYVPVREPARESQQYASAEGYPVAQGDPALQGVPWQNRAPRYPQAPFNSDPRANYTQRGGLTCWLLAIPIFLAGMCRPLFGLFLSWVLLWLLMAAGLNVNAQRLRESRRGGQAKGSDAALRLVSLPAHLVRGLLHAIPAMLLDLLISVCLVVIGIVIGRIPTISGGFTLLGWTVSVPLPYDSTESFTGIVLGVAAVIGWIVACYGPSGETIRTGAGGLRGKSGSVATSTKLYSAVMLGLWIGLTALMLIALMATPVVNWAPMILHP